MLLTTTMNFWSWVPHHAHLPRFWNGGVSCSAELEPASSPQSYAWTSWWWFPITCWLEDLSSYSLREAATWRTPLRNMRFTRSFPTRPAGRP